MHLFSSCPNGKMKAESTFTLFLGVPSMYTVIGMLLLILLSVLSFGPTGHRVKPYIPSKDDQFDKWAKQFSTYLTAQVIPFAVPVPAVTAAAPLIATAYTNWHNAYLANQAPNKTELTVNAAGVARSAFEALARPIAVALSADSAGLTEVEKLTLGVTLRNNVRTRQDPPKVAPTIEVVSVQPHGKIQFRAVHSARNDQVGVRQRAKPQGVTGIQIGIAISQFQPRQDDLVVCGTISKNPDWIDLGGENSGKQGWFSARYITRRAEVSQWGPMLPLGVP
jgi:hypothetical protein